MGYINQPFDLHTFAQDIYARLRKLELAQRFTAPSVNFDTDTPSNPRVGDLFFDTDSQRIVYWDGSAWYKLTQTPL
jgi:hypothetical protein